MDKINLVIASVLKPVNDTRMYEKFGITLDEQKVYRVHIAGYCSIDYVCHANINVYPLYCFKRLSFARLASSLKFYKLLLQLKPEVIIVNSHELLLVSSLYRILFSSRLLYDVRENYYYNLVYTPTYPPLLKHLLGLYVRSVEYITRPFITHYLLAEQTYRRELGFVKDKNTVLENRYQHSSDVLIVPKRSAYHLLYTGTISETYGIFSAISLVSLLHAVDSRYHLTIIGYAARENERIRVREIVETLSYITVIGLDTLVPHTQILDAIRLADVALLPYLYNKSTWNCMPTKLYEYLFNRIPVIIPSNSLWESLVSQFDAGISVNFERPDIPTIHSLLSHSFFYSYRGQCYNSLLWQKDIILSII
jgi:hypothetical protein